MNSKDSIESIEIQINDLRSLEQQSFDNAMVLSKQNENENDKETFCFIKNRIESLKQDSEDYRLRKIELIAQRDTLKQCLSSESSCISATTVDRQRDPDMTITLMTLGSTAVGKTTLLNRFTPLENLSPTIGIDFCQEYFNFEEKLVRVKVWDTAGQERFVSITDSYFQTADGFLLVYDIGNLASFQRISTLWFKMIQRKARQSNVILIGNKSDLDRKDRVVSYEDGLKLAEELKIPFIETSAKANTNVKKMFLDLASAVINRLELQPTTTTRRSPPQLN